MRCFKGVFAAGLAGLVLVAGSARVASAGQQATTSAAVKVDDSTLTSRIAARFKKNATIAARDIDVDVHEGIVTLKGAVRTAGEKARAAQLATVRGVTRVDNQIVVDAAAAKNATDKAIDATKRAGKKTVDATKNAVSATGEAITDGWITAKVKTKFSDETLLKGSDINVDTDDRVVTLKGTVASSAAKTRAGTIAGGTEGVTRVVNQLIVKRT